jgi:hypothetical protein
LNVIIEQEEKAMTKKKQQLTGKPIDHTTYEQLEEEKYKELRRHRGWLRRITGGIVGWISPGIASEARDDWLRVQRSLDMVRARLFDNGTVSNIEAHQLAIASAYLKLARKARDLPETWDFINQASEVMCQLADDSEKQALFERLAAWEPNLEVWLEELYEKKKVTDAFHEKREQSKNEPCRALTIHSQQWQLINQWVWFSRKLWTLACCILTVALVLAIIAAEIHWKPNGAADQQHAATAEADAEVIGKGTQDIENPFLWISVLGLFGGALSALLSAIARKVTAVTYAQSRTQVVIRLLLGASGAFVMYTLISMPGLVNEPVAKYLGSMPGFLALGILSGFSERLYKRALNRLASQFPTTAPSKAATNDQN